MRPVASVVIGVVLLAFGIALVACHRRIARWHYGDALSVRPAESVLSLRAHTIFWLGIGVVSVILGVLSVAGVVRWKWW